MRTKTKSVLMRFVKAFIGSALAAIASIVVSKLQGVSTWSDLLISLQQLAFVGTTAGITGLILAGEKAFSWKDVPPQE
jgi:hypothetical protein